MSNNRLMRRRVAILALRALIAVVLIVATVGVAVLARQLARHWDQPPTWLNRLSGNIRLTTILVVGCVVLLSANLAALERRRCRVMAVGGIACAMAAMVLGLIENWSWWIWGWEMPAASSRIIGSLGLWAAVGAVLSLLTFARLPRHLRWIGGLTSFMVGLLGILLTDVVWTWKSDHRPVMPQLFTDITAILCACGVAVIVLLHQIFYLKRLNAFRAGPLEILIECPRCGVEQHAQVGRSTCTECTLELSIEVNEANCESCGYPLYKLPGQRCPECGTPFVRNSARQRTARTGDDAASATLPMNPNQDSLAASGRKSS